MLDTINNMASAFKSKNEVPEGEAPEGDTQNASAELSEGGSVYYDGELAEGTAVFSDEAMESPINVPELALADGRSVMVADGMVTEVMAAASEPDEEPENNAEVTALNTKVEALKVTELLGSMKNLVVGDTVKKNVVRRDPPKNYADMTNFEKLKHNRENK
jgi:hypothetical protein